MEENLRKNIRDEVVTTLRRIIRAMDMHSRVLVTTHGLTGPQAVILREVLNHHRITGVQLAKKVHLSKGTISGILARLESKGLIERNRSLTDKRQIHLTATALSHVLLKNRPPLLQESFSLKFNQLADYEQTAILTSLLKLADMMGAETLPTLKALACDLILEEDVRSSPSEKMGEPH